MSDVPAIDPEIPGYQIKSLLGEGGMGVVYLAARPRGGLCALKVLSGHPGLDPSFVARFKREAQYAQTLDHPNIPELYDAGETADGTRYLAMQYVPGADLGTLLARDGSLDLAQALSTLGQIGDALDCAHASGLVHRDVKPGNIIMAEDPGVGPDAFLTDFGLSKNPDQDSIALTKQGQFVGTTAYTAPEQILGQPSNHLVDIYSLGCVLYEALVATPPFPREHELDVMYAHLGDSRPNASEQRPDLPSDMDGVIAKAMAISPADRYSSCGEFIAAASALVPEEAEPSPPSTAPADPDTDADALTDSSPEQERMPLPSRERPRLVVRSGDASGRELTIDDMLALGRLTLDGALAGDSEISRRHARVERAADGGLVVEDEDSANGTFVNGERISGPCPLRAGDQLRIGTTVMEVSMGTAPPSGRLGMRLELDLEAGELSIKIDQGASARIVRAGNGWRVETP